mmetsp:Transcript_7266/g.10277  ORF Transcript_7266/g.10277 Transcript_7266/m.10277 type:complete len:237 (+) Transcript_7266:104-814(+)
MIQKMSLSSRRPHFQDRIWRRAHRPFKSKKFVICRPPCIPLRCSVSERSNHVCLSIDLPGVKHKDLDVMYEGGALRVSGLRKGRTSFARTFSVDCNAMDITKLKANLANGVLTITLPKKDRKKDFKASRRSIQITTKPHNIGQDDDCPDNFEYYINMSGTKVDDLKLDITTGSLVSVSGHWPGEIPFCRWFSINPHAADMTQLTANLSNGVLVVSAPRKAHEIGMEITVTTDEDAS